MLELVPTTDKEAFLREVSVRAVIPRLAPPAKSRGPCLKYRKYFDHADVSSKI